MRFPKNMKLNGKNFRLSLLFLFLTTLLVVSASAPSPRQSRRLNLVGDFIEFAGCGLFGLGCEDEDDEEGINPDGGTEEDDEEGWDPIGDLACAFLGLGCDEEDVTETIAGNETTGESDPVGDFFEGLACVLLGICPDDENSTSTTEDNDNEEGGGGFGGLVNDVLYGIGCGIFGICEEGLEGDSANSTVDCSTVTDGILGGRPWFGECGVIAEFLGEVFNGTAVAIDEVLNGTADNETFAFIDFDNPDSPFNGLFAEGNLLFEIFNSNSDVNLWQTILESFQGTTDKFAYGFLEEWAESANSTNQTCLLNATSYTQPECFDQNGNDGFWVCRTLFDPFTGSASSKSVCIGEGAFLDSNDQCGCCAEKVGNATTAVPTCPALCTCECDLDGDGINDGVWITSGIGLVDQLLSDRCVDPKWAVSTTSRFADINCLEDCS